VLCPRVLLLSWISPGSGRGIVTLHLLNRIEVRSVPSPIHPTARDDIGTVAVKVRANDQEDPDLGRLGDASLVEAPYHSIYGRKVRMSVSGWVSVLSSLLLHS